MNHISMPALRKVTEIEKIVVHSLDQMLYQVSVILGGQEYYVVDKKSKLIRSHNILSIQALFDGLNYKNMVLRQQSAYDEMVGQPPKGDNTLEVPLGNNGLGSTTTQIH